MYSRLFSLLFSSCFLFLFLVFEKNKTYSFLSLLFLSFLLSVRNGSSQHIVVYMSF